MPEPTGQMDAVIAWVDGSDPAHAARRSTAMRQLGIPEDRPMNFASATRFSDLGEIYYCIASILKYAPFIRRIHIVADDQKPSQIDEFARQGLCDPDRIRIVDHREIFRGNEEFLPTFNCRTIEALMWNIDGISEYYLYFNDDFFLNAPVSPTDFVLPDGKLRLEGDMRPVAGKLMKQRLRQALNRLLGRRHMATRTNLAQAMAAQIVGQDRFLAVSHVPRPLRTDTLRTFFAERPGLLREQLGHPFRSVAQFSPYVLANQIELAAGRAEVAPTSPVVYLTPSKVDEMDHVLERLNDPSRPFGCVQSLDEFPDDARQRFRAAMAEKFAGFLPERLVLS
ncbi:stealth family protein [Paracoccus sp. (in: a-proteobacteria)]|uniref:stealth family protein n=1 Tax=Paracoccus sp. TaxID=267 RepID=UPI003A894E06